MPYGANLVPCYLTSCISYKKMPNTRNCEMGAILFPLGLCYLAVSVRCTSAWDLIISKIHKYFKFLNIFKLSIYRNFKIGIFSEVQKFKKMIFLYIFFNL
jgi:hypothetical protein